MKKIPFYFLLLVIASCNSRSADSGPSAETLNKKHVMADTILAPLRGKIDIETFGPVKIGQDAKDVLAVLGNPDGKSAAVEWAADGLLHEQWTFSAAGLKLDLSSEKEAMDTKTLFSITATSPCTFKTRAEAGIGSPYEDVRKAYFRDIDSSMTGKDQIVVGSVYGGIVFRFKGNIVDQVFLGALAE